VEGRSPDRPFPYGLENALIFFHLVNDRKDVYRD